jgi:NAD(P)-dependent dehydrogenase (short-subunit alcohol dehydrogenase family)
VDPEGKIIVVTGAAGGIGGALVHALVERGARSVIAADLDGDGVERLSEDLGAARVTPRVLDVSDEQATRALVEEVQGRIGTIDVWFANAGLATASGPEAPDEDWDRQWRINVMSHVYAARALLPGWIERGDGHLVTTASMAGILTAAGDAAYSATKHAAVGFAEWLAATYAHKGLTVHCICPQGVRTQMLANSGRAGEVVLADAAIEPSQVADALAQSLAAGTFFVLPHPEVRDYFIRRATDTDRWLRGMNRMQQQIDPAVESETEKTTEETA